MLCPPTWNEVVTDRFADDALPSEDDANEITPVEVEMVNKLDDVAPPPACPKRMFASIHDVELGNAWTVNPVEVEYLFPLKSVKAPFT